MIDEDDRENFTDSSNEDGLPSPTLANENLPAQSSVHEGKSSAIAEDKPFTFADLMRDRVYRTNLFIMVMSWSASSFCFYIIGFYLKYIPGDIFMNTMFVSVADSVSSMITGVIAQTIGAQRTMTLAFFIASIGGLCLMVVGQDEVLIMVFIFVAKGGINIAFTLCYIISAEYFPAVVCSRVFGICNIFSRISTILSPIIAEITPPVPMVIYVMVCVFTMVCSLFLKKNEQAEQALRDIDDTLSQHSTFSTLTNSKDKKGVSASAIGKRPTSDDDFHALRLTRIEARSNNLKNRSQAERNLSTLDNDDAFFVGPVDFANKDP